MSKMINPHRVQSASLKMLIISLSENRELIYQMIKREVIGRYKGSVIGLGWSFFNPILMLLIYTFVFSVIFNARWVSEGATNKSEFALILFIGLIVFNLFSETINRAPSLILSNASYVKKVVFPLEILPIISLGAAFFHALVSFIVLLLGLLIFNGFILSTALYLPFILIPLVFVILGISWVLASLGVFVRDLGQVTALVVTLLMFSSPIFYPISAVPIDFRFLILLNPLSFIIEQLRDVLIFSKNPNWVGLGIYCLIALIVMWFGFTWFQKTRKGFADVL